MENKPKKKKKSSIKPAPVNLLGQKRNKPKKRSDIRYKDKNEKQREYRDRKENGYLYLVSSGTEIETIAFLKQYVNLWDRKIPFWDILLEIQEKLNSSNKSGMWKIQSPRYRLYHFPSDKQKPFDLYFTEASLQEMHYTEAKMKAIDLRPNQQNNQLSLTKTRNSHLSLLVQNDKKIKKNIK